MSTTTLLLTLSFLFSSIAPTTAAFHGGNSFGVRPLCRVQDAVTSSTSATSATSTFTTSSTSKTALSMSDFDWPSISSFDNDDDDIVLGKSLDKNDYAVENDSQEAKAAVGELRTAPTIDYPAEPIQVPAGSQLELSEETVLGVLAACREELGTIFGYTAENRGVGITGGMDYVDMDGPSVVIRLKGRFWHERSTVLVRVANYLQQRIPEIVDVTIEDPFQLTDEANEVW